MAPVEVLGPGAWAGQEGGEPEGLRGRPPGPLRLKKRCGWRLAPGGGEGRRDGGWERTLSAVGCVVWKELVGTCGAESKAEQARPRVPLHPAPQWGSQVKEELGDPELTHHLMKRVSLGCGRLGMQAGQGC